jgi:hypothetical protein
MTLEWSPLTRYRSPAARKRHSNHRRGSALVLTSALVCALKHSVSGHVTGRRQDFLGQEAMELWKTKGGSWEIIVVVRGHRNSIPKSITSPDLGSARRSCFHSMNIEGSPIESSYELTNECSCFEESQKEGAAHCGDHLKSSYNQSILLKCRVCDVQYGNWRWDVWEYDSLIKHCLAWVWPFAFSFGPTTAWPVHPFPLVHDLPRIGRFFSALPGV